MLSKEDVNRSDKKRGMKEFSVTLLMFYFLQILKDSVNTGKLGFLS